VTRDGFLSPSLDGGWPLLELFNPSRCSSSATRAFRAAFSALSAATSAISSSRDGSQRESGSGFVKSLNQNTIPLSREIYTLKLPPALLYRPGQLRLNVDRLLTLDRCFD
jgi:hypothetical protein